ncbi:hypothetical protein IW261DRAFT_905573 [Armillaria novae-zelandiae]|uniref:Uncharacterized protein n=1 Tax=Armillaria novae-zelandiae TaxID=153914 RepID=A0AA39NT06_9AGAR|nr:hypothetical protein IW261DRAFT_905573 [Armillaria novae-zelandiae]
MCCSSSGALRPLPALLPLMSILSCRMRSANPSFMHRPDQKSPRFPRRSPPSRTANNDVGPHQSQTRFCVKRERMASSVLDVNPVRKS